MTKHRDLEYGEPLPESWLDALAEYVSTIKANLVLEKASATTVRVAAGTGSDQVAIGVNGLWRWNTADATAAHPAGAAGLYDVYAVASANTISDVPDPDVDTTDYTFGLQIKPLATPPTGNHNGRAITAYRKIGQTEWDGTSIVRIVGEGAVGRYEQTIGDGTTKVFTITHNLGTYGVLIKVQETAGTRDEVYPIKRTPTINTVELEFDPTAPTAGQYQVVVVSGVTGTTTVGTHASSHNPSGSDELNWSAIAALTAFQKTIRWYEDKPFLIPGEIKVASGDTDFLLPFRVRTRAGQTVKLVRAEHKIKSGTSVQITVLRNGVALGNGFSAISVVPGADADAFGTTVGSPDPITLADGDSIRLSAGSPVGTPKHLSFVLVFEHTVVV